MNSNYCSTTKRSALAESPHIFFFTSTMMRVRGLFLFIRVSDELSVYAYMRRYVRLELPVIMFLVSPTCVGSAHYRGKYRETKNESTFISRHTKYFPLCRMIRTLSARLNATLYVTTSSFPRKDTLSGIEFILMQKQVLGLFTD